MLWLATLAFHRRELAGPLRVCHGRQLLAPAALLGSSCSSRQQTTVCFPPPHISHATAATAAAATPLQSAALVEGLKGIGLLDEEGWLLADPEASSVRGSCQALAGQGQQQGRQTGVAAAAALHQQQQQGPQQLP